MREPALLAGRRKPAFMLNKGPIPVKPKHIVAQLRKCQPRPAFQNANKDSEDTATAHSALIVKADPKGDVLQPGL